MIMQRITTSGRWKIPFPRGGRIDAAFSPRGNQPLLFMLIVFLLMTSGVLVHDAAGDQTPPATGRTEDRGAPGGVEIHAAKGGFADYASYLYRCAAQDYEKWRQSGLPVYFHNALFHVDSAIAIHAERSEYWFLRGILYAALNSDALSMAKATESLIRTLELNPDHGRARLLLARVLQEQGKFLLAAEQYRLLIEKEPQKATGLVAGPLALCYVADDRTKDGIRYFKSLSLQHPRSAAVATSLAVLLKSDNQTALAKKELQRVISGKTGPDAERIYARDLLHEWDQGGRK
ncbi:MAG: tetratricopeptide repeat protein [Syntrophales bacterium]